MKKTIAGYILGLLITAIVVGAGVLYKASDIEFETKNSDWNSTNVQDAINDIKQEIDDYVYINKKYII